MRVLVVFCHPRLESFSGRVLERVIAGLEAGGHQVELADSTAKGFNPSFRRATSRSSKAVRCPRTSFASKHVERNEALVLIFPIWWWSFPAMLKGLVRPRLEQRLGVEFANNPTGSLLEPRPFGLIACAASSDDVYRGRGYEEALSRQVESGVIGFCGVSASRIAILNDVGWDAAQERGHLATAERLGQTFPAWLRAIPGSTDPTA